METHPDIYLVLNTATSKVLAGVAWWIECRLINQKVLGSIPGQGTGLGCGARSPVAGVQEATN